MDQTKQVIVRRRPPGALFGSLFLEECTKCGDCVAVCPSQAIGLEDDGYPALVKPQRCGDCGLCADVCMHDAIHLTRETRKGLKLVLATERKDTDV
jgi:ferredoxin-type protein NapF